MFACFLPYDVTLHWNFLALNVNKISNICTGIFTEGIFREELENLFELLNNNTYSSSDSLNRNVITSWISLSCCCSFPASTVIEG